MVAGDSDEVESIASGDDCVADHAETETRQLERTTLARKENTAVKWMGGAVFVVLLATALLVSSAVYATTKNGQSQDFKNAFAADSTKVLESFNKAVERRLEAIDALSVSITASAEETGSTFPNVTLSNFEIRCANIRVLSDTSIIHYYPIVTDETRKGWEEYQFTHQDHFDKAFTSEQAMIKLQNDELGRPDGRNLQDSATVKAPKEIGFSLPNGTYVAMPENTGPYFPLWQFSPVIPIKQLINVNIILNPAVTGAYSETLRTGQAVIESASNLNGENYGDVGALFKMFLDASQYRFDVNEYLGDPVSVVGYPVFDSFDLAKRKVSGLIGTNFYWSLYFKNILPKNTRGVVCVLRNTLNQSFTYKIDGGEVIYVGEGDQHDEKYDYLEKSSRISTYLSKIASPETKSYTSVDLNTDYCDYELFVYPSQENEDVYVNNAPIVLTVVILSIFLFTSFVFVMYTVAVQRRQDVVMDRAVASSAIVSSLFPSQVRDQIYEETKKTDAKQTWFNQGEKGGEFNTEDADAGVVSTRPIAQLFENTTIMFADMAGFTSWSSTRDPVQVFELLETVYRAFDAIAMRRKVFKVETIGDCYVAVAGLPDPQEDHAVIMTKFATDCISKMGQLTAELAEVLGPDTAELALRVGLHSGSVTGGVLRGQKSRFQLFGDTMNTASRMESNGEAGRIHISKETANELIAKGKTSWVTLRQDKVVAKGKGEMQTYWATTRTVTESVVSSMPGSTVPDLCTKADGDKKDFESVEI
jgi:class 3 adenylate cyclase